MLFYAVGLGFLAYRIIMGGGKSKVLEETGIEGEEEADEAAKGKDKKKGGDGKEKSSVLKPICPTMPSTSIRATRKNN